MMKMTTTRMMTMTMKCNWQAWTCMPARGGAGHFAEPAVHSHDHNIHQHDYHHDDYDHDYDYDYDHDDDHDYDNDDDQAIHPP